MANQIIKSLVRDSSGKELRVDPGKYGKDQEVRMIDDSTKEEYWVPASDVEEAKSYGFREFKLGVKPEPKPQPKATPKPAGNAAGTVTEHSGNAEGTVATSKRKTSGTVATTQKAAEQYKPSIISLAGGINYWGKKEGRKEDVTDDAYMQSYAENFNKNLDEGKNGVAAMTQRAATIGNAVKVDIPTSRKKVVAKNEQGYPDIIDEVAYEYRAKKAGNEVVANTEAIGDRVRQAVGNYMNKVDEDLSRISTGGTTMNMYKPMEEKRRKSYSNVQKVVDDLFKDGGSELISSVYDSCIKRDANGEITEYRPDVIKKASSLGMHPEDFVKKYVIPSVANAAYQSFDDEIRSYIAPKDFVSYAAGKLEQSILGILLGLAYDTKETRALKAEEMEKSASGQGKYYNPNILERFGASTIGMIGDLPAFGVAGKVSAIGSKALNKMIGFVSPKVASYLSPMASDAFIGANKGFAKTATRKVVSGIAPGYLNLGTYGFISGALNEASLGEDSSLASIVSAGLSQGKEMGLMGAILPFGGTWGNTASMFAKSRAGVLGAKASGFLGEAGAMVGFDAATQGDDFTFVGSAENAFTMMLGMRLAGGKWIGNIQKNRNETGSYRTALAKTWHDFSSPSNISRFKLSDMEMDRIKSVMPGIDVYTMADAGRSNSEVYKNFSTAMTDKSIPWETRNKISAVVLHSASGVRPNFRKYRIDEKNKTIELLAENGESIAFRPYDNDNDRNGILITENVRQDDIDVKTSLGIHDSLAEHYKSVMYPDGDTPEGELYGAERIYKEVADEHGVSVKAVKEVLVKDPLKRGKADYEIFKAVADRTNTKLDEISQNIYVEAIEKAKARKTVKSIPDDKVVDESGNVAQSNTYEVANKEYKAALANAEAVATNFGLDKSELGNITSDTLAKLDAFTPSELEPLYKLLQAKVKMQKAKAYDDAFNAAVVDKIRESAESDFLTMAFNGTIDGKKDYPNGAIVVNRGDKRYYVINGELGNVEVSGSLSVKEDGMIILMDTETGEIKSINSDDAANYKISAIIDKNAAIDGYVNEILKSQGKTEEKPSGTPAAEQPTGVSSGEAEGTAAGTVAAETPAKTAGSALDRVPRVKDKNGKDTEDYDWESASPEDTFDGFKEEYKEDAADFLEAYISKYTKALLKSKENFDKAKKEHDLEKMNKYRKEIASLQKQYDYWKSVEKVGLDRAEATRQEQQPIAPEEQQPVTMQGEGSQPVVETDDDKIPDILQDNPADARARGKRKVNGVIYTRQESVGGITGKTANVIFGNSQNDRKEGRHTLAELDNIQESHKGNAENPMRFITEGQPKNRKSQSSKNAALVNAKAEIFDPKLTVGDGAPYSNSSPVTNKRGEVIQGNGRVMMLRNVYDNPLSAARYRQYLKDHAEEFGFKPEDIDKMDKPVLISVIDVDDAEAIRLGQLDESNIESGGVERIKPRNTITKMGDWFNTTFFNQLFRGDEESTLAQLIDKNGVEVLRLMQTKGFITETQYETAVKNGKITAAGKNDLMDILKEQLFEGAPSVFPEMFEELPVRAQKAIIATYLRDNNVPDAAKIRKDIQQAVQAYHELMQEADFAENPKEGSKFTYEMAIKSINSWLKKLNAFEDVQNNEKYSNFALELAARIRTMNQNALKGMLDKYYKLVGDKSVDADKPFDMFGEDDAVSGETLEKADAIKKVFGEDLIKGNKYGIQGSDDVAGNNGTGTKRGQGSPGDTGSKEPIKGGGKPADNPGGDRPTGGEGEGDVKPIAPLDNVELPFEERVKGSAALTEEDVEKIGYGNFQKTQLRSAIKKLANGEELSNLEKPLYIKALQDVRNKLQRSAEDSTGANGTQLVEGSNDTSGGKDGTGGNEDKPLDNQKAGEGQSGEQDSEGGLSAPSGEGGDKPVQGTEPPVVGTSAGSKQSKGSGRTGSKRGTVRKSGGNRPGGTIPTADERAAIDSGIEDKKKAINDLLKKVIKPKDNAKGGGALQSDITGGVATWLMKQGDRVDWEAFGQLSDAVMELGHLYIKRGIYDFKQWAKKLLEDFSEPLKETFGWGDPEVDDYIREMWNSQYEIDGETHSMGEWASILGNEALRKEVKRDRKKTFEEQQKAESIEVKVGNRDNIDDTLPFLLKEQRDDVEKAERQFFDETHSDAEHGNGKGMLFTNGTGTGKTYTGLGIIKRFVKQGKGRVLIVTPTQEKVTDWKSDGKNLGLDIYALGSDKENGAAAAKIATEDKGKGVVITTYANMRANSALLEDTFDLIVYDESHRLMENKLGKETSTSIAHHMLANRDIDTALERYEVQHPLWKEEGKLNDKKKILEKAQNDARKNNDWDKYHELDYDIIEISEKIDAIKAEQDKVIPELRKKAAAAVGVTKVVFLSATPFNTRESLDYAESYLFTYGGSESDKRDSRRSRFLSGTFPDAYVQKNGKASTNIQDEDRVTAQEIAFADKLMANGTMSGRTINNGWDYSRDFPNCSVQMATEFNMALEEVMNDPDFSTPSGHCFAFNDYQTMSVLFETMKVSVAISRIRQHLDLGRKVVVFHRRVNDNRGLAKPPFAEGLKNAAEQVFLLESSGNSQKAQKLNDKIKAFRQKYSGLLKWEQSLDYSMPRVQLEREFGSHKYTDAERRNADSAIDSLTNLFYTMKGEPPTDTVKKVCVELSNALFSEAEAVGCIEELRPVRSEDESDAEYAKRLKNYNTFKKTALDTIKKRFQERVDAGELERQRYADGRIIKKVGFFAGADTKNSKHQDVVDFNEDNSEMKIIVVQEQSGKEGISLHDLSGKHQRVMMSLALPQSPITFIQAEGRIFRIGNESNAIFEYPLLGINQELSLFAQRFNGRAGTTENLALGSLARGLKESIARGVLEHTGNILIGEDMQGIGGKEYDARADQKDSPYNQSITDYITESERRGDDKENTPEPIGFKMVEWGQITEGESVLEPSAGDGSIARYFPSGARTLCIEPSGAKYTRLALLTGGVKRGTEEAKGRKHLLDNGTFEELNKINKADVILMNSPKDLRQKHFEKAYLHLNNSGRIIVAGLDANSAEMKAFFNGEPTAHLTAEIKLPGQHSNGIDSILIIDKMENAKLREKMPRKVIIDLSKAETQKILFDKLRDMKVPNRTIDPTAKYKKAAGLVVAKMGESSVIKKTYGSKNISAGDDGLYLQLSGPVSKDIKFDYWQHVSPSSGYQWGYSLNYGDIAKMGGDIPRLYTVMSDALKMDDEAFYKSVFRGYSGSSKNQIGGMRELFESITKFIRDVSKLTDDQIRRAANGENVFIKTSLRPGQRLTMKDLRAMFEDVNEGDADYQMLFDKVMKVAETIGMQKGSVFSKPIEGRTYTGWYSPSENNMSFNSDFWNSNKFSNKERAELLLHELTHSVTSYAIHLDEMGYGHELPEKLQEAIGEMKSLQETIKTRLAKDNPSLFAGLQHIHQGYIFENLSEFVAEGSANPKVRDAMKKMGLWVRFKNAIKKFFGISEMPEEITEETGAEKSTVMEQFDVILDKFLENFDQEAYDKYIRLCNGKPGGDASVVASEPNMTETREVISRVIEPKPELQESKLGSEGAAFEMLYGDKKLVELRKNMETFGLPGDAAAMAFWDENKNTTLFADPPMAEIIGEEMVDFLTQYRDRLMTLKKEYKAKYGNVKKGNQEFDSNIAGVEKALKWYDEFAKGKHRKYGDHIDDGILYKTSDELDREYPGWQNQTNPHGSNEGGHTTQISSTRKTYQKVGQWMLDNGMKDATVLDASSGLGLGTLDMRGMGLNVEDVEPFAGKGRQEAPTYTSYDEIDKQYDLVVSNAVLNVIPDNWRADVLKSMADKVKVGGKMFINCLNNVSLGKNTKILGTRPNGKPNEVLTMWDKDHYRSYQHIYSAKELADYVKEQLGDGWKVETAKKVGIDSSDAIVVTRETESVPRFREVPRTVWKTRGEDKGVIINRINEVNKSLGGKGIAIHESADDVQNAEVRTRISRGDNVMGWYDRRDGSVHLYLPNIHSRYDAEKTVIHEKVGHAGLEGFFGKDLFKEFIHKLWYDKESGEMRKWVAQWAAKNNHWYYDGVCEWLAQQAESNTSNTFWSKIVDKFYSVATKLGFMRPSVHDMRYLSWLSRNYIKNGVDSPMDIAKRKAILNRMRSNPIKAETVKNDEILPDAVFEGSEAYKVLTPKGLTAVERYNDALSKASYIFKEAHVDRYQAAKELVKAITGGKVEDLPSNEDFVDKLYAAPAMTLPRMNALDRFVGTYLNDAILKAATAFDVTKGKNGDIPEELESYLYKKHALERNRIFFVRDFINSNMKKADEQEMLALAKIRDGFYALQKQLRETAPTFDEYIKSLDDYIRENIDSEYNASESGKTSGLSEIDGGKYRVGKSAYDDAAVLADVMDAESRMGKETTKELWDTLRMLTDISLENEYEFGLISKDQKENAQAMFEYYLPLRGWADETAEDMYSYMNGTKMIPNTASMVHAKGRNTEAFSPLATAITMAYSSINRGVRNGAKQAFMRFIQNNPSDLVTEAKIYCLKRKGIDGEDEYVPLYPELTEDTVGGEQMKKILDRYYDDIAERQANGEEVVLLNKAKGNITPPTKRNIDFREHLVDVVIGGKKRTFVINGHPRAAQAINGMVRDKRATNVFAKPIRFMSKMATSYSWSFATANGVRDAFELAPAFLAVKENWKYVNEYGKNYGKLAFHVAGEHGMFGLAKRYKNGELDMNNETDKLYKEFVDNGGITGYVSMFKIEDAERKLQDIYKKLHNKKAEGVKEDAMKVVNWYTDAVSGIAEGIENATRFATYMTSRKMGRGITRCIADAKNVSSNFNRTGSGNAAGNFRIGKRKKLSSALAGFSAHYLKNYLMFYNAGVQGLYNMHSAYFKSGAKGKATMLSTYFATPFALGALIPILNTLMANAFDDEEGRKKYGDNPYNQLPDYERRTKLNLYIGHGKWLTLPVAIDLRFGLGLGDMVAGFTYDKKLRAPEVVDPENTLSVAGQVLADVFEQFSQITPVDFASTRLYADLAGRNPLKKVALGYASALTPSVVQPIVSVARGYGWTGAKITGENANNDNIPAYQKGSRKVGDAYVAISKMLNDISGGNEVEKGGVDINPSNIEYLINQYLGGPGKDINEIVGTIADLAEGEEYNGKAPILKNFYRGFTPDNSKAVTSARYNNYYSEAKETMADYKDYKRLEKKGSYSAMMGRMEMEKTPAFARAQVIEYYDKRMKKLRDMRKEFKDDREYSGIIQGEINELMQEVVGIMDAMEEGKLQK